MRPDWLALAASSDCANVLASGDYRAVVFNKTCSLVTKRSFRMCKYAFGAMYPRVVLERAEFVKSLSNIVVVLRLALFEPSFKHSLKYSC